MKVIDTAVREYTDYWGYIERRVWRLRIFGLLVFKWTLHK